MAAKSIPELLKVAGSLASAITTTIKDLSDLRSQLEDAGPQLRRLIGELSTLKSTLTQISDWTHYLDETHRQADVVEGLTVTLAGCQLVMEALAEEVRSVLGESISDSGNHKTLSSFEGYDKRLHAQIAALQLLLEAVQW